MRNIKNQKNTTSSSENTQNENTTTSENQTDVDTEAEENTEKENNNENRFIKKSCQLVLKEPIRTGRLQLSIGSNTSDTDTLQDYIEQASNMANVLQTQEVYQSNMI